jgi:double-stranded uracil-DNA glycosylase
VTRVPRFTRAELESFRGAEVPDLVGPGTRLLFVGINPGLRTAAIQTHFGNPVNRFWPSLYLAGIVHQPVDVTEPMTDEVKAALVEHGLGITNLVRRATARADELTAEELRAGADRLRVLVEELRPPVAAVLGITAYRSAFGRPKAVAGRQPEPLGPAELWVVPNPSGLNAHESLASLARAYAEVGRAAGIVA